MFTWNRYMHGGAESGFRRVKPEQYKPRLFHFHGDKRGVMVKEVDICKKKKKSSLLRTFFHSALLKMLSMQNTCIKI